MEMEGTSRGSPDYDEATARLRKIDSYPLSIDALNDLRHFSRILGFDVPETDPAVLRFVQLGRQCAMAIMENAAYMRKELANVAFPEECRDRLGHACDNLIGTKHDIINELGNHENFDSAVKFAAAGDRVVKWISETIHDLLACVDELQQASQADPRYSLAFILAGESASNIVNIFNQTKDAVDAFPER